jgi:hypothetical protein
MKGVGIEGIGGRLLPVLILGRKGGEDTIAV